jgi:hypothetical protein
MARFSLQGVPWMVSLDNQIGNTLEELGTRHPDWHRCNSHSSMYVVLPKPHRTSILIEILEQRMPNL